MFQFFCLILGVIYSRNFSDNKNNNYLLPNFSQFSSYSNFQIDPLGCDFFYYGHPHTVSHYVKLSCKSRLYERDYRLAERLRKFFIINLDYFLPP